MAVNNISSVSYGLNQPLTFGAPQPIVSQRNPTANDQAQIGTLWINTATNAIFTLTSITAGASVWTATAGGAEVVASLTVNPGPTVLIGNTTVTGTTAINTVGAAATTIGTGGTGAVNIGNATGNTAVTGSLNASANLTANGTLNALTGDITATLGNIVSTAGEIRSDDGITFTGAGAAVVYANGITITAGTGAPVGAAPQGSLYLRTDGNSTSTRAYINTNGATVWTAITTAA